MYNMDWDINFTHQGKAFKLVMLESVEIQSNVEVLADTASIVLPEAVMNSVLNIQNRIGRGAYVTIDLGYNGKENLVREFEGYIREIETNESSLTIRCEDALFLFRKDVKDEEIKNTSVSKIAQKLINQIDKSYKLVCDHDLGYEKFTIHRATAFDVLKKLGEETKANIYFKTAEKELHIRSPFLERGKVVKYSFQKNIESASLEYKTAADRKFEVTVESVASDGTITTVTKGTTGGEKTTIKVGALNKEDLGVVADAELLKRAADRYEGSFDAWLLPVTRITDSVELTDEDYPEKDGRYYVKAVKTSFSASGGVRTIELGVKL